MAALCAASGLRVSASMAAAPASNGSISRPCKRGGHEADGGEHGGAAADPVFHREAGDEVVWSAN